MKNFLVVDDSPVIRKVACKILEDLDFSTDIAVDGSDALEKCERNMPDAVLLDWNMPIMNGLDFLVKLRSKKVEKRPTVIFCTTENDFNHIMRALQAGADEYIMKPFDKEILRAKLEEVGLLAS